MTAGHNILRRSLFIYIHLFLFVEGVPRESLTMFTENKIRSGESVALFEGNNYSWIIDHRIGLKQSGFSWLPFPFCNQFKYSKDSKILVDVTLMCSFSTSSPAFEIVEDLIRNGTTNFSLMVETFFNIFAPVNGIFLAVVYTWFIDMIQNSQCCSKK